MAPEGLDAVGLAASIRRGEWSPVEVCQDAIDRIERRDVALNAVVIRRFEEALEEAEAPVAGPFSGVPFLLKDLGACLEGMPQYQGNQLLQRLDWRAPADGPLARRIVDAGFVCLGKTNTPEFGAGVDTQPKSFGPTRNPWDLTLSPSGSSGGAAAAVAAGLVLVAHGNDFGGSIRAPAAWCGLIGLKPSKGRVSTGGPPSPQSEFVLTRSLRDTAALLDVIADPASDGAPAVWSRRILEEPPRSRIGLLTGVAGVETEADGAARAEAAAAALAERGHEVVRIEESLLADERWEAMQLRLRANGARARLDVLRQLAGRPLDDGDVEPMLLALDALAPTFNEDEHAEASAWQLAYADRLAQRWRDAGVDAVVTPATGVAPQPLESLAPSAEDPLRVYADFRRIGCFLGSWNLTGHAAISVPWWHPERDRLPRGIQIVVAPGAESLLLQLARQLTEQQPDLTAVRIAPPH